MLGADFLRADGFALELVGAVSEAFCVHLTDHGEGALVFLDLSLGEVVEVGGFCGDEEHGGGVLTGGDACATANAGGGIKGGICICLWDGDGVGVWSGSSADADVATSLDDAIEGGAVCDEVFENGEGVRAEGLDPDGLSVREFTHVQLTGGDASLF